MGFFDFLTEEIAIDLGTANTLIIHKDKVVVDSPSIVAIDRRTNKVIAILNPKVLFLKCSYLLHIGSIKSGEQS